MTVWMSVVFKVTICHDFVAALGEFLCGQCWTNSEHTVNAVMLKHTGLSSGRVPCGCRELELSSGERAL